MKILNKKNAYVSLCYHYIRPVKKYDHFPRILGNNIDEFHRHIKKLLEIYNPISLQDAYNFSYSDFKLKNKYGILFTFDDGLSDHYIAAQILAEHGIKATFFIPTCIIKDNLPANPTIIHYCLAEYGIKKFLHAYRDALEENKLPIDKNNIKYNKGDNPWGVISKIKENVKYKFSHDNSRKILLYIYNNLLKKDYKNALEIMHLTRKKINKMISWGHSIGAHSHSHISIGASELNDKEFKQEVIEPKNHLELIFNTEVIAMSYPFGGKKDCLVTKKLLARTDDYKLAFSVEEIINTKETSPLNLGRYMLHSTDTKITLNKKLSSIIDKF